VRNARVVPTLPRKHMSGARLSELEHFATARSGVAEFARIQCCAEFWRIQLRRYDQLQSALVVRLSPAGRNGDARQTQEPFNGGPLAQIVAFHEMPGVLEQISTHEHS